MTDIERLDAWLESSAMTRGSLAKQLKMDRSAIYKMVERKQLSAPFITKFIQQYGCDVAVEVFVDALTPTDVKTS